MAAHKPDAPVSAAVKTIDVTIAINQSLSGTIDLTGYTLVGIVTPAAWTAADITLVAATTDGGTYNPVYENSDTEFTLQVGASRFIVLPVSLTHPLRFIQIRSGTAGVPVTQAAARTLNLIVRPIS